MLNQWNLGACHVREIEGRRTSVFWERSASEVSCPSALQPFRRKLCHCFSVCTKFKQYKNYSELDIVNQSVKLVVCRLLAYSEAKLASLKFSLRSVIHISKSSCQQTKCSIQRRQQYMCVWKVSANYINKYHQCIRWRVVAPSFSLPHPSWGPAKRPEEEISSYQDQS
jgi:hypothetical protein